MSDNELGILFFRVMFAIGAVYTLAFIAVAVLAIKYRLPMFGMPSRDVPPPPPLRREK